MFIENLFTPIASSNCTNAQVQFGSLSEYFDAVRADWNWEVGGSIGRQRGASPPPPALVGDFFPYADAYGGLRFWTGFFSTRPHYKLAGALLHARLRVADTLLWRLAVSSSAAVSGTAMEAAERGVVSARRTAALFLHHDTITGTSKDFVVLDMASRCARSLNGCLSVTSSLVFLSNGCDYSSDSAAVYSTTQNSQ